MLLLVVGVAAAIGTGPGKSSDCQGYPTHEQCVTGDKCIWEEHAVRCMNFDQPHDCISIMYPDECKHLEPSCAWNAPTEQCYHAKDGPRCDLPFFEAEDCLGLGETCTWHSKQKRCARTHGNLKCFAFHGDGKHCNEQKECKFDATIKRCHPVDFVEACDDWQSEEDCSGKGREGCKWSEENYECFDETVPRICEHLVTDVGCAQHKHCEWIKESGVCHRSDLDVACYRLYHEGDCEATNHCVWSGDECATPTNAKPCDWSADDQQCLALADRCEWDPEAEFCKRKGMPTSCERYIKEDVCNEKDKCKWKQGCFDAQLVVPCEEATSARHCYKIACEWKAHNKTCTVFKLPKDETLDEHHNPRDLGNMVLDEGGNKAQDDDGEHAKPDCTAFQCPEDDGACPSSDEEWMQSPTECCPRCGYTSELCARHVNMDTCPDKCAWHEKYYACLSLADTVPCQLIPDPDSCKDEKLRPDKCDWHSEIHTCVNKGEAPECEHYQAVELCAEQERCSWHEDRVICADAGADLQCKHYRVDTDCTSHQKCKFDAHVMRCMDVDDSVPCGHYTNEGGCTQDSTDGECTWFGLKKLCLAKTAKVSCEYRNKFECATVNGCKWDAQFSQCNEVHDFIPLACSEHGSAKLCAEEAGCYWHNAANKCIVQDEVIPCNDFYGEWECANAEGGQACTWDDEAFVCLSPGEMVPCDKWFEVAKCKQNKCAWSDEYIACHPVNEEVPCHSVTDEKRCGEREDCKFFFHMCHHVDKKIPCQDYFSEVNCNKEPGCKFYPNDDPPEGFVENKGSAQGKMPPGQVKDPFPDLMRGKCSDEDQSVCSFIIERKKCHPRATNGKCAYDSLRHMCRELQARKRDEL